MSSEINTERYLRQLIVRDFGGAAQARLANAHIAMIGLGGIGASAALSLVGAGIGKLTIFEDDVIELSNLHRQPLYDTSDIGTTKAQQGIARLRAFNPECEITARGRFDASAKNEGFDLLFDGSDRLETRHQASRFAVTSNIPLLAASVAQWEGQIGHFHPQQSGGCYHCLYPETIDASAIPNCSELGVIGALALSVANLAALEAIKIIAEINPLAPGQMLLFDGAYRELREITIAPRPNCEICQELRAQSS